LAIVGDYTTDTVLNDALVMANQPDNGVLTQANLLRLGNDQLMGILTGKLMSAVQGYCANETTQALTLGTYLYTVPAAAMGAKLRYVTLGDSAGNRFDLASLNPGTVAALSRVQSSRPLGFYMQGNQIGFYPTPDTAYTAYIGYYQRPGRMVSADTSGTAGRTGVITSIGGGGTLLTVSTNTPANANTLFPTTATVDIVRPTPPFSTISYGLGVSASTTTTVSVSSGVGIAVGDYVQVSGEAGVPQIPAELHPLLATRWAIAILRARGAVDQAQSMTQQAADMETQLFEFLSNRVEEQVVALERGGLLSSRGYGGGSFGWW
jgi:hypothetical protein